MRRPWRGRKRAPRHRGRQRWKVSHLEGRPIARHIFIDAARTMVEYVCYGTVVARRTASLYHPIAEERVGTFVGRDVVASQLVAHDDTVPGIDYIEVVIHRDEHLVHELVHLGEDGITRHLRRLVGKGRHHPLKHPMFIDDRRSVDGEHDRRVPLSDCMPHVVNGLQTIPDDAKREVGGGYMAPILAFYLPCGIVKRHALERLERAAGDALRLGIRMSDAAVSVEGTMPIGLASMMVL